MNSPAMKITVILCTYNRCQSLATALESLAALQLPESVAWEVLVVDNNSNDQTRPVIEAYCRKYPGRFQYLFEARPGKSHALNAGIRQAGGDILAFVDDDVTVEPEWLQRLTSSLNNGKWVGSGGRVLPEKKFSPPRWMSTEGRYALAPLAVFDLGLEAKPLDESPFGTNMAFQKRMFEKYGDFRTDLGPRPGSEIRNEDTEFGRRLLEAGERLRYEPDAVVYHSVPQKRIQKDYFLRWWFDKSRADVREFGTSAQNRLSMGGIPLSSFRRLATWTFRWILATESSRRFSCKINVWSKLGEIVESYHVARHKDASR